eukprot:5966346-Heterocapsa_arctica.AAC.1
MLLQLVKTHEANASRRQLALALVMLHAHRRSRASKRLRAADRAPCAAALRAQARRRSLARP